MTESAVHEIKARLDLADTVGAYVALKRSGRSYKGLCPFHGEKTPSFYVFPDTGTWKCFGCGEGGDIFTFVQKRENLDFGETLRMLADKAGLELPSRQPRQSEAQAEEDRLRALLVSAELYFKAALTGGAGRHARRYLGERGVEQESVDRFSLGYAPGAGLLRHLQEAGYPSEEAVKAGVAGQRDDGSFYEMFRSRLIFPIRDAGGRTIAFGGRIMEEGQPKYLNGPQTAFFDKSNCLFALDLARATIRQSGQVLIVEGYFDAIIAHQSGFQNVVATLGTALTERHLERLGRTSEIILALDADAAGRAATLRGLEVEQRAPADSYAPVPVAVQHGQLDDPGFLSLSADPRDLRRYVRAQAVRRSQIKVLTMPSGLDPDVLIRRDPSEWQRLVGAAMPVVDFLLERLAERHDLGSARGKRDAVQEAAGIIRDLTDPVEREHYVQRLAAVVGVDESGLRFALHQVQPRSAAPAHPQGRADLSELPEAYALALYFLSSPGEARLTGEDISSPEGRAIFERLARLGTEPRDSATLDAVAESLDLSLRPAFNSIANWLPRLISLSTDERTRELELAVLKLHQRRLRVQHQEILSLLKEPEHPTEGTPILMLSNIASQLRDIEAALAQRDGIGSLVWRSRQVGEVLGG